MKTIRLICIILFTPVTPYPYRADLLASIHARLIIAAQVIEALLFPEVDEAQELEEAAA